MSKRLRASLASKRGRMLRPRSSSLPPPGVTESDSIEGEELASESETLTPAPVSAAPVEVAVALPTAVEFPPPPLVAPAPAVIQAVAEAAPAPLPPVAEVVPAFIAEPTPPPEEVESLPPPAAAASPGSIASSPPLVKKKKKKKHHADGSRPAVMPGATNGAAAAMPVVAAKPIAPVPPPRDSGKGIDAPKTNGVSSSSHRYDKPALISASGKADEEVDLSISHKFFVEGESLPPPLVHEPEHELEKIAPPTKEALAHRARLKRIVGGVVAAASLFAVIGVGRMVLTSKSANAMPTNTASNANAEARLWDPLESTCRHASLSIL